MMDAILQILKLKEEGLDIALGSIYLNQDIINTYFGEEVPFGDNSFLTNRYFQEALQILKYKEKYKNVIILSGKVHTANHLQSFKKMDLDISYMGFVLAHGGGAEWNCQPLAGGCKAHSAIPYRQNLVTHSNDASLIMLNGGYELFDGAFVFKKVNASYPFLEAQVGK